MTRFERTFRAATLLAVVLPILPVAGQSLLRRIDGASFFDSLSISAGGRDLDGDGVDDYLVAAPLGGTGNEGSVAAYSGSGGALLWTRTGLQGDRLGNALALIDDLNGDGVADVVVGAPGATFSPGDSPGALRVFSGANGGTIYERYGTQDGGEMGHAVAAGFDWDKDGVEDFAGGAPLHDGNGMTWVDGGKFSVWSGVDGSLLGGDTAGAGAQLGHALAGVGDVNADGYDDLGIGAPYSVILNETRGGVFVYSDGGVVLVRYGTAKFEQFGYSLAPCDYFSPDANADFLVGSPGYAFGSGRVQLISGATGSTVRIWDGVVWDLFGSSVARIGDVDGDGLQDFVVGAPQTQADAPGYARVFSLQLGQELFTLPGDGDDDQFGHHVSGVGDVNGDGTPDFGVGAPGWDGFASPFVLVNAGQVSLYSGGGPGIVNYCTAGASASGCKAQISASGKPSASASSGFSLSATDIEGDKAALFFFGWNGRQAKAWGNGSSFQCVTPPVTRGGTLAKTGTNGSCDGAVQQDLNALWKGSPNKNPGPGAVVRAQLWYRDPMSTSNQATSFSDAVEFVVGN